MKNIILWGVGVVVLVMLIVGASALYNDLSEDFNNDSAITDNPDSEKQTNETIDTDKTDGEQSVTDDKNDSETEETETDLIFDQPFPSPDFTVVDINGNNVNLSDMRGRPIVVNFWGSWCGYCVYEMPDFEAAYKKYGDRVVFMMINNGDTVSGAKKYVEDNGFTFPIYFDPEESAQIAYNVYNWPRTYIFDKEGNLSYSRIGLIDSQTLTSQIELSLK